MAPRALQDKPAMLCARLEELQLVGTLEKKGDHFVVVCIDEVEVVTSERRSGLAPLRWEPQHTLQFRPSSKLTIKLFRRSTNPLRFSRPHQIGHHTCDLSQLFENNSELELIEDSTGRAIPARLIIKLTIIHDLAQDIMSRVDADLAAAGLNNSILSNASAHIDDAIASSRVGSNTVKVLGSCVEPLGNALKLFVKVMDSVADVHPIVKASWTVLSATYKAVQEQLVQDENVISLAESLREVLGVAQEVPDLTVVKHTTDVIEEIGRVALEIASLIDQYTRHPFAVRTAKSQITDDMKTHMSKCQQHCMDLMEKFRTRLGIGVSKDLKVIKDHMLARDISAWLKAPDSSPNYNDACKKHKESTGSWFLDGKEFSKWKESGRFFCIYGKAGCGKTVLCSSVITNVANVCNKKASSAFAYFFFDGRDAQSMLQRHDNFIRSVIQQFMDQCDGIPSILAQLYGHGHQQPSTNALEDILEHILSGFADSYIIIDSLDECVERRELLNWMTKTSSTKTGNLHVFATSRPEEDIKSSLGSLASITMEEEPVNGDIREYIDSTMKEGRLSAWPEEVQLRVKYTLLEKAEGMFRWLAMQLEELQNCLNEAELYDQLERLPKDLDETYYRILMRIPEQRRTAAKVFLQWTAFSARPLRLDELGEAAAFEFDHEGVPKYNPLRKLQPRDVLVACASLIIESEGRVKLSHFSVKEYLNSERISSESVSFFGISEQLSHSYISRTCLAYLRRFTSLESLRDDTLPDFPLARYAAEKWVFHMQLEGNEKSQVVQNLVVTLFECGISLTNWIRLYNPDESRRNVVLSSDTTVPNPLYFASLLGFSEVVRGLLEKVPSPDAMDGRNINSKAGIHGTALGAACGYGHLDIVKLLLDRGADVNAGDGRSLVDASSRGYFAIVNLLLDRGADMNAGGGYALVNASSGGHIDIVKLLIDRGADINAGDGKALAYASWRGHIDIVKLLLDRGADTNAGDVHAFVHASFGGYFAIVKLLLDRGADVNAGDGRALVNASSGGHIDIVKLLLDRGADMNAGGGYALVNASFEGHIETVKLLLDRGADINAGDGYALVNASFGGYFAIVNILLDRGADMNAGDGKALAYASRRGHIDIVKLLLDRGADMNAGDGHALVNASSGGHIDIVKLLLDRGADVNAGDGRALVNASSGGHIDIVKLLLDRGADINAADGEALATASRHGRNAVVRLLLDHGAKASADILAS